MVFKKYSSGFFFTHGLGSTSFSNAKFDGTSKYVI